MSPEVVNRLNYNENVDIWSMGILLYELINGTTPFVGKSNEEIMSRIKVKTLSTSFNLVFTSYFKTETKEII